MRALFTLFISFFILCIAFSSCTEPVAIEPPPADPPSLSQKLKLTVEGEPCIDSELEVTCNKNSTSGSGTSLWKSETQYFFSTVRTIWHEQDCINKPIRFRLMWSGPLQPSDFNYILSNVDDLHRNSNTHNFDVFIEISLPNRSSYISLRQGIDYDLIEVLDPNASSNFSYSISDTICDYRTTSTLILEGNYSGYLFGGLGRNTDSLYVELVMEELLIGHMYY